MDKWLQLCLILHAVATWCMLGVIWYVQIVHYPLFAYANKQDFKSFHLAHTSRTTWVVAPLMIMELVMSVSLVFIEELESQKLWIFIALACLILIWFSTLFMQMPQHYQLEKKGYQQVLVNKLVAGNWIRTICWTLRSIIAAWLLWNSNY